MRKAAYCGTREVYADMETAAKSLIANSNVERVYFFIEDDEFPTALPDIIECHNVSGQTYFPAGGANYKTQYTYMTLMRAALCHLLPAVDVVLSLDTDTVAIADCSDVFDTDIDGCYFAATQEKWPTRPGVQYCNVGVAMYNLAKLRDGKADEVIDVLNTHCYRWPEQDALNYLCQGRIAPMDSAYNYCPWVIDSGNGTRIVHYAARDDFRDEADYVKYKKMSWQEAMERHSQH